MPKLRLFGALSAATLLASSLACRAQVVLVAGAHSPAGAMTTDQAASVFLGKSDKVPGIGTPVLVDEAEGSPAREQFYAKVTGKSPAQVKAAWTRLVFSGKAQMPREAANAAEVKKLLDANPNAIGYLEKNAVDSSVKVLLSIE